MARIKKAQMGKKVSDRASSKSEAGLPKRKNYDSVMNEYLESTKGRKPAVVKKKAKNGITKLANMKKGGSKKTTTRKCKYGCK